MRVGALTARNSSVASMKAAGILALIFAVALGTMAIPELADLAVTGQLEGGGISDFFGVLPGIFVVIVLALTTGIGAIALSRR